MVSQSKPRRAKDLAETLGEGCVRRAELLLGQLHGAALAR